MKLSEMREKVASVLSTKRWVGPTDQERLRCRCGNERFFVCHKPAQRVRRTRRQTVAICTKCSDSVVLKRGGRETARIRRDPS